MNNFWESVSSFEEPTPVEIEYRLYYEGRVPLFVTTEKPDGTYLVITSQQYNELRLIRYRVIDGKLKKIPDMPFNVLQLEPCEDGEFCTLPGRMMFVADDGDRYSIREDE